MFANQQAFEQLNYYLQVFFQLYKNARLCLANMKIK